MWLVKCRVQHYSFRDICLEISVDDRYRVFQIAVIELSFLVGFLAFVDSLKMCTDPDEVPTASFEAPDAS